MTFEEVRAHMGVETQRQCSDRAIGRTTPILMGLFSLACVVLGKMILSAPLQPAITTWYDKKGHSSFSNVIATIRRSIWSGKYFIESGKQPDSLKMKKRGLELLINSCLWLLEWPKSSTIPPNFSGIRAYLLNNIVSEALTSMCRGLSFFVIQGQIESSNSTYK